jgi:starvation-inducible DNA-binding protein
MYDTRNDLELRNARLADAIDLRTQVKMAHWNVKGPEFIALPATADALAGFGRLARRSIEGSSAVGDQDTADIFTEISRGADEWL